MIDGGLLGDGINLEPLAISDVTGHGETRQYRFLGIDVSNGIDSIKERETLANTGFPGFLLFLSLWICPLFGLCCRKN